MALFKSRQGHILWQELPEFLRNFDAPVSFKPDASVNTIEAPGDLHAFLLGFGHVLDRYEATLQQFYADGFMAPDPMDAQALEIQEWLVPYFADLFGVTLYGPDPNSRRSELANAIWVARRRGTQLAVDRAAESILQRAVVAVPGTERILFTPSIQAPLLTQGEILGDDHAHVKDAVILHQDMAANLTYSQITQRHHGLPRGLRHIGLHMRAVRVTDFRLDTDSKPAHDPVSGNRIPTRFGVRDKAGVPCFAYSFEDRALRTPDIRAPRTARQIGTIVSDRTQLVRHINAPPLARPDSVVLHVDPPPGFFDGSKQRLLRLPDIQPGLSSQTSPDVAADRFYIASGTGDMHLDVGAGTENAATYDVEYLFLDGTLVVGAGVTLHLDNFAVKKIVLEQDAKIAAKNGICDEIDTQSATDPAQLEYVTVMKEAKFRSVNASDCIFAEIKFSSGGRDGCVRFSRIVQGSVPSRIKQTSTTEGPVNFLLWPCLIDPNDNTNKVARQALFGESGYGVLSPDNPVALTQGAEDGGEPGAYRSQFHLARLAAAQRRAEDFTPAGTRVFAHYDMRSAAPLPDVVGN